MPHLTGEGALPPELRTLYASFSDKATAYAALGLSRSAAFHAEKAAAITSSASDTLTLARLYHTQRDHHRALHVLSTLPGPTLRPDARLLAAQCLFDLADLDECLAVLGDDADDASLSSLSLTGRSDCRELHAALCVMRARVYQRLENPTRALLWYKRALRCDLACFDAFLALAHTGLMSMDDAAAFVNQVTHQHADDNSHLRSWLITYFRSFTDSAVKPPPLPEALAETIDVRAIRAHRMYHALDFHACAETCRDILRADPFADQEVLIVYLASLVELDERHELFSMAHKLVDRAPKSGLSWLAVGYYYFAVGKLEIARRFLQKATTLNPQLAPAWVAFGHAFGAQDESDQAMASYRTASRLFPGAQLPMLFMGMEYARQSSLGHAAVLFHNALKACPSDPAPRHEMGVVVYRMGDHARAAAYFKAALSLWEASDGTREVPSVSGRRAEAEEATLVNLGHCYRRLREFSQAKTCYERALGLNPRRPGTCAALGMTLHAIGDVEAAVGMYHRALRHNPDDANTSQLLERALWDVFATKSHAGQPGYAQRSIRDVTDMEQ